MMGGYNGWTNHATWECAVGVLNKEGTYNALLDEQPTTPEEAEAFCARHGYTGEDVNWIEIAESFREEFDGVSRKEGE